MPIGETPWTDWAESILAAIVSLLIFRFAWIEWPGFHWDAPFFIRPVLNVASGQGWRYGGYLGFFAHKGNDIYDFHGILHILFYGLLLRSQTWKWLSIWMGVVNVITFLLYYGLYRKFMRSSGIRLPFLAILLAIVPAVIAIGLQGRPEQLGMPLMAMPLLLYGRLPSYGAWLAISGVISGLLGVSSPLMGSVYAIGFLIVIWILGSGPAILRLRDGAWFVLATMLTVVVMIDIFTPYEARQWIVRTILTGRTAFDSKKFLFGFRTYQWGFSLVAPLWNLVTLFAVGLSAWALVRRRLFLPLAVGIAVISLAASRMLDYGFLPFLPLALCGLCHRETYLSLGHIWPPKHGNALKIASIWALLFAYVMGAWLAVSINMGQHFHAASLSRRSLAEWLPGELVHDRSIAVGYKGLARPSPLVLLDPRIHAIEIPLNRDAVGRWSSGAIPDLELYESKQGTKLKYYILPQKYPFLRKDLPACLTINGRIFQLMHDNWTDSVPEFEERLRPRDLPDDFRFALFRAAAPASIPRQSREHCPSPQPG
jgi:hypothetical protein